MNISGADVSTPEEAAIFLGLISVAYTKSAEHTDTFIGNMERDGVTGKGIEVLKQMREQATLAATLYEKAAYEAHAQDMQYKDGIGSRPSIAGTQNGGYGDQRKSAGGGVPAIR